MENSALNRLYFPAGLFLLFAWRLLHFGPEIDAPHDWRQCDTAWYIRDFHKNGVDLLHPAVCWMGTKDTLVLEFPLPEAVVACGYRFFGESIPLARLIFLAFFGGAVYYFYRVSDLLLGPPMARLATLVYLALPLGIFYSRAIHVDFSVVLLVHAAFYYFLTGIRNRRWPDLLASSAAAGLALAIKAPYLFCLIPAMLVFAVREKATGWVFRTGWLYLLAAGMFVLWQRHVDAINGAAPDWNYILNYRKMASGHSFHWYFGAFGQRLSLYSWKLLAQRGVLEVAGLGGILFLLAGFYSWTSFNRQKEAVQTPGRESVPDGNFPGRVIVPAWLAGTALYLLVFFNLNVIHNYYQIPLLAPVAILVAAGLERAGAGDIRRMLFLLGALVVVNLAWSEWAYFKTDPLYVEAGRTIREKTPDTALVVVTCGNMDCRDPRILYRAGRRGWSVEEKALRADVLRRLENEEGAQFWAYVGGDTLPSIIKEYMDRLPPAQVFVLNGAPAKLHLFKLSGSR